MYVCTCMHVLCWINVLRCCSHLFSSTRIFWAIEKTFQTHSRKRHHKLLPMALQLPSPCIWLTLASNFHYWDSDACTDLPKIRSVRMQCSRLNQIVSEACMNRMWSSFQITAFIMTYVKQPSHSSTFMLAGFCHCIKCQGDVYRKR